MNGAKRFEELDVWKLSEEIRVRVLAALDASEKARTDRKFCDQIRDAAEDAVSDIAEGFGRFKPREFAQFLGYAITSTSEVKERTRFAHGRKYFPDLVAARIVVLCVRADKAMRSLRRYLWSIDPSDSPTTPTPAPAARGAGAAPEQPRGRTTRTRRPLAGKNPP